MDRKSWKLEGDERWQMLSVQMEEQSRAEQSRAERAEKSDMKMG